MKLLALFTSPEEQALLQTLADTFSDLYTIDCLALTDYTKSIEQDYQAILTWQDLPSQLPQLHLGDLGLCGNNPSQDNVAIALKLAHDLIRLNYRIEPSVLGSFPYQASLSDKTGQVISSNQKPSDPFDWEEKQPTAVPKWIMQHLTDQPKKTFYMTVPSPAFDQILVHTYQLCHNDQQEITGVFHYVQDIKPLLADYLTETGQALVGWSDVTSGASIHNDTFDY